MNFENSL